MTNLDFNKLSEFCNKEYKRAEEAVSVTSKPIVPIKTTSKPKLKIR